jgi:hypothetical protein
MNCFYRLLVIVSLILVSSNSFAVDPPKNDKPDQWIQSYNAGYTDENGAYAGGSEIMHLVSHKGKLFAANGYWVDSHWKIPPDHEKQSAQVLRLDSTDASWQVDLELGKTNGLDLMYMKGNILKSVTFTRDAHGKLLDKPANLLVMSSGANFERGGAVSAWVRNDEKGTWTHNLVRHGSNSGGVRWVPRDIEVYRDTVTGIEHIFLLLGNPGIISGVYDPTQESKIRWARNTEYPFLTKGSLTIRPLGLVQANGSLYFSAGSSIYKRIDGERPTYEEVLNLNNDTDTDVGGIRGLTAIDNPNGPGESIIFLWAPGARSMSQVKRLDPDKNGSFTVHDEANMRDLMSKELGVGVSYTLGAHNMMYPVIHPATGKKVHIIGFQGNLQGKNHLKWKGSNLYAGAMFAVRTEDQKYSVHEVNNSYEPGKAILISPRAFCLSPFGKNTLFVGGHDSSNKVSDDMSWVFKAPLEVALGVKEGLDAPIPKPNPGPEKRWTEGPVYELRIYTANEGRHQHLINRFKEHTDRIFKRRGLEPVGYWLPVDAKTFRRMFVYILKHPSRYAAYVNWTNFNNDREWDSVLDKPEFQRLLSQKPESIFMSENDYSSIDKTKIEKPGGVFELRTYTAAKGKLADLNSRFREHTTKLFEKHGMTNIGYWNSFDNPESENTLIYLIHHTSRAQADENWKAFSSDPEWQEVARKSQIDGKLLSQPPARMYLRGLDFSPYK